MSENEQSEQKASRWDRFKNYIDENVRGGKDARAYEEGVRNVNSTANALSSIKKDFKQSALTERRLEEQKVKAAEKLEAIPEGRRDEAKKLFDARDAFKALKTEQQTDKTQLAALNKEIESLTKEMEKHDKWVKSNKNQVEKQIKNANKDLKAGDAPKTSNDIKFSVGGATSRTTQAERAALILEKVKQRDAILNKDKYKDVDKLISEKNQKEDKQGNKKYGEATTYRDALKNSQEKLKTAEKAPKTQEYDAKYQKAGLIGKDSIVLSDPNTGKEGDKTFTVTENKTGIIGFREVTSITLRDPKTGETQIHKKGTETFEKIENLKKIASEREKLPKDERKAQASEKTGVTLEAKNPNYTKDIIEAARNVAAASTKVSKEVDKRITKDNKQIDKALNENKNALRELRNNIRADNGEKPLNRMQMLANRIATKLGIQPKDLLDSYRVGNKEVQKIQNKADKNFDKTVAQLQELAKKNGINVDIKAEIKMAIGGDKDPRLVINKINDKIVEALEKQKGDLKEYEQSHKARRAIMSTLNAATLGVSGAIGDKLFGKKDEKSTAPEDKRSKLQTLKDLPGKVIDGVKNSNNLSTAASKIGGAAVVAANVVKTAFTKAANTAIDGVNKLHEQRTGKEGATLINPERKFEESTFKGNLNDGKMAKAADKLLNPNESKVDQAKVDAAKINARNNMKMAQAAVNKAQEKVDKGEKHSDGSIRGTKTLADAKEKLEAAKQNLAKAGPIARAEIEQQKAATKLKAAEADLDKITDKDSDKGKAAQAKVEKYDAAHGAATAKLDAIKNKALTTEEVEAKIAVKSTVEKVSDVAGNAANAAKKTLDAAKAGAAAAAASLKGSKIVETNAAPTGTNQAPVSPKSISSQSTEQTRM